jgi:hypothetical protein
LELIAAVPYLKIAGTFGACFINWKIILQIRIVQRQKLIFLNPLEIVVFERSVKRTILE